MDKPALKDHKQLGQELELFFNHEISPGAVFWLPKGMTIFKELEKYIRKVTEKAGYLETSTPIMVKNELFKKSGHWDKFGEHNMYNLPIYDPEEETEIMLDLEEARKAGKVFVIRTQAKDSLPIVMPMANYSLKPMNCPESTILFMFKSRSYKELPLRFSELGKLHRREKSGEVHGLLRVRQLTMDDAHIYCTNDQIFDEVSNILDTMIDFYKIFGFEYEFRFATRPEQRAGIDQMWDEAEKDLAEVLKQKRIKASDKTGDGAFYGPKVDMHIKDAHGREWQLATVQLDFHQPKALGVTYVDKDGADKTPVMIHRAIFGSFERFIAILTEHYQGAFPVWLSPVQMIILPIADRHLEAANEINRKLQEGKIRSQVDNRQETLQAKIRDATLQKVPYMGIIGDKEIAVKGNLISVRTREGKDLGQIEISAFLKKVQDEIDKKI